MCPICLTTATVVAASTTSGAGVLGFIAFKYRALRRQRREPPTSHKIELRPHDSYGAPGQFHAEEKSHG